SFSALSASSVSSARNERLEFANKAGRCFNHELAIQLDRLSPVSANGLHRLQQIAAVAGTRGTAVVVVALMQVIHGFWASIHSQLFDHGVEDPLVDVLVGRVDGDLVADTPQEGVVHQVLRIEVGREDRKLLEGDLELLAGRQGEEVAAVFEGRNPAVKQLL